MHQWPNLAYLHHKVSRQGILSCSAEVLGEGSLVLGGGKVCVSFVVDTLEVIFETGKYVWQGWRVLQSIVGHVPDFLQCRVNIFISLAFRYSALSLVDKQ